MYRPPTPSTSSAAYSRHTSAAHTQTAALPPPAWHPLQTDQSTCCWEIISSTCPVPCTRGLHSVLLNSHHHSHALSPAQFSPSLTCTQSCSILTITHMHSVLLNSHHHSHALSPAQFSPSLTCGQMRPMPGRQCLHELLKSLPALLLSQQRLQELGPLLHSRQHTCAAPQLPLVLRLP
jgi:hypothetical protein